MLPGKRSLLSQGQIFATNCLKVWCTAKCEAEGAQEPGAWTANLQRRPLWRWRLPSNVYGRFQTSSRGDPCVFNFDFFRTPLWGGLRVLRFCRLVQSSTTGYTLPLFKLFSPSTMSLFAFLAIFTTGHQLGSATCSPPGSTTSSSRRRRLTSSLVGSSLSPFWCLTSGTGATTCHKLKAKQRNERKAKPD